jgi:hypothetical protein
LGNSNLTQAKCNVITKAIISASDSTLIRIEHNWIAPDRFKNQANANGFVLADARYWKVDGINLGNIQGFIQFPYNANAGNFYLDSTWIKNTEDSIRLFYRKDATQEWTFANDSLRAGSFTDKTGSVYAKEIKAGEYCFGIKRSNYIDPIVSDVPTGGCGLVTSLPNPPNQWTFKVYPNPATNQITIEFPNTLNTKSLIELFDLTGKKVLNSKQITQQKMIVNLPHLPQGIYSLKVTANDKVYFEKVVIE